MLVKTGELNQPKPSAHQSADVAYLAKTIAGYPRIKQEARGYARTWGEKTIISAWADFFNPRVGCRGGRGRHAKKEEESSSVGGDGGMSVEPRW